MSNTEQEVIEVVSNVLGLEANQIGSDSLFQGDLGADSIDVVEVVIAIEDKFGVDIPDERAEQISSIKQLVACIEEIQAINSQED
ncbi:acyl carrier protein [Gammaproteobacteria bacterium]|nr:acyl carrier protein [Gammaproteobacteria bacterium]